MNLRKVIGQYDFGCLSESGFQGRGSDIGIAVPVATNP
jgi:hypothetical protein